MNAERGRGGRRGRGRNSSGHHKDHRSGGRGVYRSNSDGQGTNAVPPGLRVSDTPNQYSTSVANTSGWDSPSNHQQSGANDQLQAAIQAADRALNVPRQQQGHRGNRDNRRESGGLSSSNPSPGFGQSHSGRGRGSDTVLERESRPGSFGRRSSGTRPAQSNIVAIPQRYVNASNKPFQSPGSTQQATQQGTPNSRHQNGTASYVCQCMLCVDTSPLVIETWGPLLMMHGKYHHWYSIHTTSWANCFTTHVCSSCSCASHDLVT